MLSAAAPAAASPASPAAPPPPLVAAACLGRLGQWGNQVFQYAACVLAAELHGGGVACPDWPGRLILAAAACDPLLTAHEEDALPLCADRPVLSHPGWRAWAATRAPLAAACTPGQPLSGRQARLASCVAPAHTHPLQSGLTRALPAPRCAACCRR
jgi:hypothetical protein